MNRFVLLALLMLPLLCEAAPKPTAEMNAVLAVLTEQQKALRREDVAGVMSTILSESPMAAATEALLKRVHDNYDFRYDFSGEEVRRITATEAEVSFVQVTERLSGPEFRKNRIHGTHILRKDPQGKWKFFDTKILRVDYLEK
jgi:hypothetical protein